MEDAPQDAKEPATETKQRTLLDDTREALRGSTWTQVGHGLKLPWKSAGFLMRETQLLPYVILPALINIVLFAIAAFLLISNAGELVEWLWTKPGGEGLLGWLWLALWYVVYVLAILIAVLVSYAFVLVAGGIVASPFNDLLCERTERILTGRQIRETEESLAAEIIRSAISSGGIALMYAVLMVPILLLNLIPVIGSAAATLLGGSVSAFFLALEYTDPVLERYQYGVREKFSMIYEDIPLTGSFGLGTSLMLWLPLLNFVCMPIAVVGGTSVALALMDEDAANSDMGSGGQTTDGETG